MASFCFLFYKSDTAGPDTSEARSDTVPGLATHGCDLPRIIGHTNLNDHDNAPLTGHLSLSLMTQWKFILNRQASGKINSLLSTRALEYPFESHTIAKCLIHLDMVSQMG